MKTDKYYCEPCDKVVKALHGARCPHCGLDMINMGTRWRPGRVGTRTRMYDARAAVHRRKELRKWGSTQVQIARPAGRKRRRWAAEQTPPIPQAWWLRYGYNINRPPPW